MEEYDAIIIGGGHNGLLAGAYLARAGAKVLILERRWETGGAVMTDEQSGFRINTHACYMMMMDQAPAYDDLELSEFGCTYIMPQPALAFLTRDNKALCLYSDVEKSAASIARFSEKDAARFKEVYAEYTGLVDECIVPQTYRPTLPPLEMVSLMGEKEIESMGDLDNFMTGICDGLQAADPRAKIHDLVKSECIISPLQPILFYTDAKVFEINAKKVPIDENNGYYEVKIYELHDR